VFIHKLTGNQVLNEQIPLIVMGGMVLILMILITTSILLNLEQSMTKQAFISIGSVSLQFGPLLFYFFLEFGLSILSVQSTLWFYWDFINYDVLYLD
jgi:membrane protein